MNTKQFVSENFSNELKKAMLEITDYYEDLLLKQIRSHTSEGR